LTVKNPLDLVYQLPVLESVILSAVLKFPCLLKQDGFISLVVWPIQITGRITELLVYRVDHRVTGGDLDGAHVPPALEY